MSQHNESNKCYKILMFTHPTSDNIGDQMIEVCSHSLLDAVMCNLSINKEGYTILSKDAGFVNKRYLSIQEEDQNVKTEKNIESADLILFGGAPMFNYKYEGFSERTVKTLKLIQKYNKPVIFSAIGVEDYEPGNIKCIRLKQALAAASVKMITTRDNFAALKGLAEGTNIVIDKVADPVVFAKPIFRKVVGNRIQGRAQKKIGIFVIRGAAFKDNKMKFSQDEAIALYHDLARELEAHGYDYEYITTGSHSDENFLASLTIDHGIPRDKCVLNVNTPDEMVSRINSYDGVIACRLHANITCYALNIPAVGLVWNNKVSQFYEAIGYPERSVRADVMNPKLIVSKLEAAMETGVDHDEAFFMTIYDRLFSAVRDVLCPGSAACPFSYTDLLEKLQPYEGADFSTKVHWKFSRIYKTLNSKNVALNAMKKEMSELKKKYAILFKKLENKITIFYNCGRECYEITEHVNDAYIPTMGKVLQRTKSIELAPEKPVLNDGSYILADNIFMFDGYSFEGWRIRLVDDQRRQFLLLDNGNFIERIKENKAMFKNCRIIKPGQRLPVLDYCGVFSIVVFEAVWNNA